MKKIYYLILLFGFFPGFLSAQELKISGKVTNASDNTPIAGVSISIKNSSGQKASTLTNENGLYSLSVPRNTQELVFSHIGMVTVTRKIDGQQVINVVMNPSSEQMEQVVITALGIKREAKALSYSRQSMDVSTMTEAPTTNIISALSGRIAGIQVTPSSTNTGSARIVIRGNNSITGNNQPLFVIDGMPVDNGGGDGSVTTSGNNNLDYGNVLGSLNPEDIQNIEVLKGPNAAALYGSRAANGAILITTKKSGGSKFKVAFNSNSTFQRITEFPDYQNVFGAGNSFKLDGSGSTSNPERIPDLSVFASSFGAPMMGQPVISINGKPKLYLPQPDNVKDFYQTASMLTNSVSVEGGNAENNYRFSYTNYLGGSVVAGINKEVRNNLNLRILNKFNKWLDMDSKVTFINNKVTNRQYMNGSNRNPVYQYAFMVRDDQLSEFANYKNEYGNEINTHKNFLNPYWAINENSNEDTKNQLLSAFNLNAKFNSWLKMTAKLGTQMYWLNGYTFNNRGAQSNPNGSMSTLNNTLQSSNADIVLFANNKVGKLSVNSFIGTSRFKTTVAQNKQNINSLIQPGLKNMSNSGEFPSVTQFQSDKIIYSAYGSVSLGYANYLFMDVTGRNDWSSTLPENNNSYFYPSVGGSFVFTDAFKIPRNILSFGKLRASSRQFSNSSKLPARIP
ncbi:MAG: SusC/RagA family TonB-linked outer membrane protein, partial [Ginsengibacter sp.]